MIEHKNNYTLPPYVTAKNIIRRYAREMIHDGYPLSSTR